MLVATVLACLASIHAHAAEWQWSVPLGAGRAFLWIPPDCRQVRAVAVGQNNMIEQGILEHPILRQELAKLGIAEIFIAPPFGTWQNATNNDAANETFNAPLKSLADDSGSDELQFAKIPPRAKFPVKVAVVVWQLGSADPKLKTAVPVTQEFFITK